MQDRAVSLQGHLHGFAHCHSRTKHVKQHHLCRYTIITFSYSQDLLLLLANCCKIILNYNHIIMVVHLQQMVSVLCTRAVA